MSNADIVNKFFSCYKAHDYEGMHSCLDKNVKFSDFAFKIQGSQVKAMWHWFCVPYLKREKPVDIPDFELIQSNGDVVLAKYRVKYLYGDKQRPVDYFIKASFVIQNDKIVEQTDIFSNILPSQFTEMALGFPRFLAILPPISWIFRVLVQKKAVEKLNQFMKDHKY